MTEKITARSIIQIAGKPKENVEKALNVVINKIKEQKEKYKIIESDIAPPELDEKTTLYSGLIETTIKFQNTEEILGFILDYTPSSIEIENPQNIKIEAHELTGMLNDISRIILNANMHLRNLSAQVQILKKENEELKGKKQ